MGHHLLITLLSYQLSIVTTQIPTHPSSVIMSEENSCCGFKRKTVCMSLIGLCCPTLVVWTVIITASPLVDPNAEKGLNNTNVTVSAVCPLNASLAIDEVSLSLSVPENGTQPKLKKIKLRNQEADKTHCKCLCQANITETDLLDAIKELQRRRREEKAKMIRQGVE